MPLGYQEIQQILTHLTAFLILLYLLTKYLWAPFLKVIDERSAKIREEFDKADELQTKFEKLRLEYEDKLKEIEARATERMNEAIAKGQEARDEILAKANAEAADIRERVEREVQTKLDGAALELKEQIVSMTIMATEKLLGERLDDSRHRHLVAEFINKVGTTGAARR